MQRSSDAMAMDITIRGYPNPTIRRYSTPTSCIAGLSVYRRMTSPGNSAASVPKRIPTASMKLSVTPYARLMPSSSFAPKYWAKNSMPPPTKPQYPLNIRDENCAQRPTAPTSVCPRDAIIIVSTMDPVVVSRFCSATGTAITATLRRKLPQANRLFIDSAFRAGAE